LVFIPWAEIENAAEALPPFASSAVDGARQFVCALGRNYEDFFVGPGAIDPLGALRRGVVDKICGGEPPPPPPGLPPYGGDTCSCVSYDVVHTISQGGLNPQPGLIARVTGPIFGLNKVDGPAGTKAQRLSFGQCANGQLVGVSTIDLISGPQNVEATITDIRPTSGSPPAVCTPPRLPDQEPPIPPPPEAQKQPIQITIAPNVNVTVPVVLVKPEISVRNDVDIEVNVGPININFGLGGVTVDLAPNLPPGPPDTPVPLPPPGGGTPRPPALPPFTPGAECPDPCVETDLTEINEKLDEIIELAEDIKECACEPEYDFSEQTIGNSDGGLLTLPQNTYAVRVVLQQIPNAAKIEFGRNTAPNVYYAGWYSFAVGNSLGDRRPLSYESNTFDKPETADKFSFTVRSGYTAQIVAKIKTKKET